MKGVKDMKKRVIIIMSLLVFIFIVACSDGDIEEEELVMISKEKLFYAEIMQFQFRIIVGEEEYNNFNVVYLLITSDNQIYDQLVFVHSEVEATVLPDSVIAAWPTDVTTSVIEGIHWAIERDESEIGQRREVFSLEDFGLSYPLTAIDLVSNWEKEDMLWSALTVSEQTEIIRAANRGDSPSAEELDTEDVNEASD